MTPIDEHNANEGVIYKLILSDEKVWGFTAAHKISPWLETFADIMQLKQDDNVAEIDHQLTFLALKENNAFPKDKLDLDAWTMYKNGRVYRVWSHSTIPETFIELNQDFLDHEELKYVNMWSSLKPIFRFYVESGGGPVHAACAEVNGKGIVIAASGGVGKSTCSQRLPEHWNSLSDDTTLILNANDQYRIHPMPTWSDHLWSTKYTTFETGFSVPLSAIFFLEQGDCDEVTPLAKNIAAQYLFESQKQSWESYWSRIDKEEKRQMVVNTFNNSCNIMKEIPCYTLKATLNGKFWEEIEKVL